MQPFCEYIYIYIYEQVNLFPEATHRKNKKRVASFGIKVNEYKFALKIFNNLVSLNFLQPFKLLLLVLGGHKYMPKSHRNAKDVIYNNSKPKMYQNWDN